MSSPAQAMLNGLRRSRRWANQVLGREVRAPIQVQCRREFLGSTYGGWCVCPDRITPGSLVYSFGVGQDITWDLAMIERFGVEVHAFDPTPKSIAWIREQQLPAQFHFHEFGIASYDGAARFELPRPDFVSYAMNPNATNTQNTVAVHTVEAPVRRLTTLMEMLGHAGKNIDVLKMDIEGAENDVIEQFPTMGVEIAQVLVEFHHRVGHTDEVNRTRRAIDVLNRCGYRLFFNSAVGMEYSFIRP